MLDGPFWDALDTDRDYNVVEGHLLDIVRPLGVTAVSSFEVRAPMDATPFLGRLFGKRDGEYTTRYRRKNLSRFDVAAQQVLRSEHAFSWSDVRPMARSDQQREVFDIAGEHGFRDGWIVPYYGAKGGIGFTTFLGDQLCDSPVTKRMLTFSGLSFYRYAQGRAQGEGEPVKKVSLTKRQKEILYWIAKGKTDWEMSQLLNIAERTVNRHVEMLKQRLDVRSRTEALAVAITHNLIDRL